MSEFGRFVKEARERKGLSLREFCRLANLDPGNWSKVERGIFPPPKNRDSIADIATILLLAQDSEEWNRLFELAAVGHIPAGILAEPSVADKVTVFFRLTRGPDSPDRSDRATTHASGIVAAGERARFARAANAPNFKLSGKPSGKPVAKPGSIRSSKGGRGR